MEKLNDRISSLNLENRNLFIVEDDAFCYEIMNYYLSETKAKIFFAETGTKALDIISNVKLDLIFLDIHLPEVDGFEIVKFVRNFHKNLPVVAQTSFVFEKSKAKILDAGFNDILVKPITQDNLYGVLYKNLIAYNNF